MIKAIYWDLGGVCIQNSLEPSLRSFDVDYGEQQKKASEQYRLGKISTRQFFIKALKGTPLEGRVNEVEKKAHDLLDVRLWGALPLVIQLYGKAKQGVISNHSPEMGKYIQEKFGLENYFDKDLIIFSGDVGMDKTNPEIFKLALKRAGTKPEETLFWDDQQSCVDVARKAGLHAEVFGDRQKAIDILCSRYDIKVYRGE